MKRVSPISHVLAAIVVGLGSGSAQTTTSRPQPTAKYIESVNHALASKADLWGEELMHAPQGPTIAQALGYLHPLWHQFRWYSASEVYYLPFGMEDRPLGGNDFALHYADGSEITTRRAEVPPAKIPRNSGPSAGERITFFVGPRGKERYGSALSRLATPQLGEGYLPILTTRYRDAARNHFTEESFAIRIRPSGALVSFIHFTIDSAPTGTILRIHFTRVDRQHQRIEAVAGLAEQAGRVIGADGKIYLLSSPGARLADSDLSFRIAPSSHADIFLARPNNPAPISFRTINARSYLSARQVLTAYWQAKLDSAAQFLVPEPYAMDAERNLLIQNLLMNVRYSIGNPYEIPFNSESHFSIQALGEFGFLREYRAGLEAMLANAHPEEYEIGERLLHAADYYFLTRDAKFLQVHDAEYRSYISHLSAEMARNHGLLNPVPTGTDIAGPTLHFNMHQQAVAWRGLRDMAEAWRLAGEPAASHEAAAAATELGRALRRAITASSTWLPDGSLFIPVHLLEPTKVAPFDPITATKEGAYWLLVATDGFAAGILDHRQDEGVLRYLYDHGANMLGLIRFNYTGEPVGGCNANGLPGYAVPGIDNAYLPSYIEFLADNDQADRLVLSFYGKLAQGMTRNTFVAGEGDSAGVCQAAHMAYGIPDAYYRTMYLPPNSTNNAAYLLTLRTMLVHESFDADGRPTGLDLAFSTPRPWLADGKRIAVRNAPTDFGRLNYTLTSHLGKRAIDADIAIPERDPITSLRLRLRVPGRQTLSSVRLDGRAYAQFSPDGTIDLSGLHGHVHLTASFRAAP